MTRYSRVIKIKHAWRAGELLACQSSHLVSSSGDADARED